AWPGTSDRPAQIAVLAEQLLRQGRTLEAQDSEAVEGPRWLARITCHPRLEPCHRRRSTGQGLRRRIRDATVADTPAVHCLMPYLHRVVHDGRVDVAPVPVVGLRSIGEGLRDLLPQRLEGPSLGDTLVMAQQDEALPLRPRALAQGAQERQLDRGIQVPVLEDGVLRVVGRVQTNDGPLGILASQV